MVTTELLCSVVGLNHVEVSTDPLTVRSCGDSASSITRVGIGEYSLVPPVSAAYAQLTPIGKEAGACFRNASSFLDTVHTFQSHLSNPSNDIDFMITWYGTKNYVTSVMAPCDDIQLYTCVWPTTDNTRREVDQTGFHSIATWGVGITGILYQVTSFLIDGNEQLSSPFLYGVSDSSVIPPVNYHTPLIQYDGSSYYITNFSHIFTDMFAFLNLPNWLAIAAPGINLPTEPNRIQIAWPETVATWSITLIRPDGNVYTYSQNGRLVGTNGYDNFDSTFMSYMLCNQPTLISTIPMNIITCRYPAINRARYDALAPEPPPAYYPMTYGVSYVIVNGVFITSSTTSITLNSVLDLNVSGAVYTNQTDLLNTVFTANSMLHWLATTISDNIISISIPDNVISFEIGYYRINNGFPQQNYVFREDGILMGIEQPYFSSSSYQSSCTSVPI
jgi:hypothetical protein